MNLLLEGIQAIFYLGIIVVISKYMLVKILRNLAESLNLKSKTVGDIAGVATSMPELFTVCLASFSGLNNASIFNILSSNIINFILYSLTIIINKNIKILTNRALKIDLSIAIITILIPIYLLNKENQISILFVIFMFFLFGFFYRLNSNAHKLYLKEYENNIEEKYREEKKWKAREE